MNSPPRVDVPFAYGRGLPGRAIALGGAQNGFPTGTTGSPLMPLMTPAADAYQATTAVMIPIHPPSLMMPVELLKNPIHRMTSVASRVRNTPNTATFTAMLHRSM